MHRVADCVIGRVIPQPIEWQNIGYQIDAGINVFLTLFRPDLIKALQKFPPTAQVQADNKTIQNVSMQPPGATDGKVQISTTAPA